MIINTKINSLLDKTFNKLTDSNNSASDLSNIGSNATNSKGRSQDNEKNFKILALSLKIICLLAFLPYALLGMFFINKSFIFIPCLILATLTVLIAMFSNVKMQILQENMQNKFANIAKNFKNFINQNSENILNIKGIEILEKSINKSSEKDFINQEFITSSLINGSVKISKNNYPKDSTQNNFDFDDRKENYHDINSESKNA